MLSLVYCWLGYCLSSCPHAREVDGGFACRFLKRGVQLLRSVLEDEMGCGEYRNIELLWCRVGRVEMGTYLSGHLALEAC